MSTADRRGQVAEYIADTLGAELIDLAVREVDSWQGRPTGARGSVLWKRSDRGDDFGTHAFQVHDRDDGSVVGMFHGHYDLTEDEARADFDERRAWEART